MAMLITGATGFIGARMAERFHELGIDLVLLGRLRNAIEQRRAATLRALGLVVHEADIAEDDLSPFVANVDLVIHLAAAQHEANRPEEYFRRINVHGTRRILEASITAGVHRFLYGSTIGVYGQARNGVHHENHALAPESYYGRTKLEAERAVREYDGRIEIAIARIAEAYGPGDYRLLKLFNSIKRGLFLLIGEGSNIHQVIYIDDLIDALYEMGTSPNIASQPVVLSGDEALMTKEMCEVVASVVGRPLARLRLPLMPFAWTAVLLENTLGRLGFQPPLHRRRLDFFRTSFHFPPAERNRWMQWRPTTRFYDGAKRTAQWYRDAGLLA